MEYGGNAGGSEFNWNYMGGTGGGGSQNGTPYCQMGQLGAGYGGGGQQWLHSNQANSHNSHNYQQPMPHTHSVTASPFDDYNQSMLQYSHLPKSEGVPMGQQQQQPMQQQHGGQSMGMSGMGNSYGGYPPTMSRNGLGNPPSPAMGQGANGNYGGSW